MDDSGNILIKRLSSSDVFVMSYVDGALMTELALEADKPLKLFDMRRFQSAVAGELRRGYPDRRRLEAQCVAAVCFVHSAGHLLDVPVWILLVNVVAIDMIRTKMPPSET
jgi:hypothetical protein